MADGYSRSAKVGFSIVAKNLEDLTKTNDLFDNLIEKGKKADSILSNLGSHYSDSGLSKFKDGLSGINDQLDKITDKSKDFASTMNGHLKSVADDSNKSAGRMSSAFSKATDKIKHGMDNISDNKEVKFKTNASQLQRDFKKTQDQTDETKDSLSSMRHQLDRNNNSIKLASREHDSYISALKSEGNYTKASREELKGLRTSYYQLSTQLNKEKNYLAKVKDATGKTSDAYMKQSTKVNELRSHVASTKDEMARMNVTADRSHTAFGRLYNAGSKLSNMGTTVSMAMIPVAAAFKKAADEATNLQNRYMTIKNLLITGGESSSAAKAETAAMQKENNRFALQYGVSPTAMARGGEELVRRGYNGKQELASHKYFLQAARASGDPYNEVVNYGAPTLEQFGYKTRAGNSRRKMAAYTKKVLNEMAYGADLTATNFEGMGNSLRYVGATAHSSNQGLARTVAGVGVLSNNGQDGSIAGTGLRKVMNSFAAPNMKSQQGKVLLALGLKPSDFQKANGQVKSLADNMDVLKKATSGMSSAQKFNVFHMFFGTTGQESGLILANNTKQLRSLTGQVGRAQKYGKNGYIQSLAKKNMQSWKNQIDVFKQYVNIMGMGFAKTILPLFTKALGVTNKFLKVLIGLPSPIKKAIGYATAFASVWAGIKVGKGLLGLSSSLLFGKGHKASIASRALSTVEDVTGASPLAGSQISREEKASATRTHFAQSRLGNAATALSSDKLLNGMSYATIGFQIGGHAVSAFKHGIDSKQGGSQMWQAGGNAVGAGLGLALSGGNPLVAMIGSSVGGSIAKSIAGSKYVKNLNRIDKNHQSNPNRYNQVWTGNGDRQNNAEKRIIHHPGYNTDIYGMEVPNNHQSSSKATSVSNALDSWTYASLNKANRSYVKQAVSLEQQGNIAWARAAGKSSNKVSTIYNKLYKLADKQANKQLSSSEKGYSSLRKQGLLSSSAAEKATSYEKSSVDSRLNYLKSHLRKISADDNLSGAKRANLIQKVNARILSLTDIGANKQKLIMRNLMSSTTHLTVHGYAKILTSSKKNEQQTISSARKTYNAEKSSANKRYETNVHLAKTLPKLSASQRRGIIKQAEKQRSLSVSKAYWQYKDSVKYAERQRKEVVNQAKKEAGEAASAFSVAAKNVGKSIPALITQNLKLGLSTINPKFKSSNFTKNMAANNRHGGVLPATKTSNGHFKAHNANSFKPVTGFANGGKISHAQTALVGEGGLELAYTVNGRHARILGANGPEIARVKSGERILNHRDTKKVLSGSYGHVLPGYAVGNMKLGSSNSLKSVEKLSKKTVKDYKHLSNGSSKQLDKFSKRSKYKWSNIHKETSKITDSTQKKTVTDYDQLQKGSYKQLAQFDKGNTSKWRNITSDTKHYTNQSKNQAISTYDTMQKGVQKQMDQLHSGVVNSAKGTAKGFGGALGKMDNYAHSAMSNTVHQLNGGIKGIDKVLGQFGGNSSVINAIHYATGSNGALTRNQLAMVNDAGYGSRQEAIVHNGNLILPSGRNRMMALQKGDQVLNGSQTKKLASMYGLSHFAKGSGVSHAELNKIISKNNAHPNRAFTNEFSSQISKSNTILGNAIKGLSKRSTTKYGNPWSTEVWHQMDNARSGGGSGAGGNWRHTPGLAESDPFGASRASLYGAGARHDGVDFSGPLGSAIRAVHGGNVIKIGGVGISDLGDVIIAKSDDGFKEIYQEFGKMNNIKVRVGDTIHTGQKIATLGQLNGAGNGPHVHIGVTRGNPLKENMLSTHGWFDVTKMHGHSNGNKRADTKHSSALSKLVAKEIAPQLKWVSKHLKRSAGSIGSLALSGDIASRARALAAAIKKAYPAATNKGIAAVLGNWEFESGLNPTAVNSSGGASGLGQWLGGRISGLKSYASRHGKSWKNAGVQLDFALHDDSSNSSILKRVLRGNGSVSSLANEFSNDWERGGYNAQHVAGARKIEAALSKKSNGGWSSVPAIFGEKNGEPEVAINPKRSSADRLLMQAIAKRVREAPSSIFGKLFNSSKRQKEIEDIKKFSPASFKIAPTSKKPAKVTEQKAVFSPNITVNVNVSSSANAKKVGNEVAKQVEDIVQRMFKKEYNVTETGTL